MTLSKETTIDQITVEASGVVLVREAITIVEDGEQLSKSYHRTSFSPGSDVSAQPANVQAICSAAWTPEVVAAYKASNGG